MYTYWFSIWYVKYYLVKWNINFNYLVMEWVEGKPKTYVGLQRKMQYTSSYSIPLGPNTVWEVR